MAKYFYDCEFLEGKQKERFPISLFRKESKPTIDLISIGIVSEDRREFYEISKDFNLKEAWNRFDITKQSFYEKQNGFSGRKVYWIRDNVLLPIFYQLALQDFHLTHFKDEWYHEQNEVTYEYFKNSNVWKNNIKWFRKLLDKYGKTNSQIAQEVFEFISQDTITLEKAKYYDINYKNIELYGYYSAYDHVSLCWLFGKMKELPNGFPMYTKDLKQELDEQALKEVSENAQKENIEQVLNSWKRFDIYPKQENEHNALSDAKWNYELYKFLKSPRKE